MTARVVLRPFDAADEPSLAALFAEPSVGLWNPGPAPDAVRAWWWEANAGVERRHERTWAITDPDDDRLLGTVAVFGLGSADDLGEAEIGYRVRAAEAGRGVATAAVTAAVRLAVAQLAPTSIRLVHAVDNAASCRVAIKAGFPVVGTVPGTEVYGDGLVHDEHVHRRLVRSTAC